MGELSKAGLIERCIYAVRGQKVMLDRDLAALYGVRTKELNKAVKRNAVRFPPDFMFRLTAEEAADLRFQNGTSSWGGRRYQPNAFTELGVAMLSSVLNSKRAIQVNMAIMRAFVRLRQVLAQNEDLARRIEAAEKRLDEHRDTFGDHAQELRALFELLHRLMAPIQGPRPAIGFKPRDP